LWLKVFRRSRGPASEPLQDYFREIFFNNPWRDESLPSLVFEERGRGIVGFLGVLPRTMTFNERPIKVAVATQLMVDEDACPAYAAAKLVRKFFTGEQDLSLSDGASEDAERLWQAADGEVALLDSLAWTRVLRPTEYVMELLKRREPWMLVAKALRQVCRAVDAAVVRSRLGRRYWLPEMDGTAVEEQPGEDTLLWCIRHLAGNRALKPEYELDSFRWLLRQASEKQMFGGLRKGVVRDTHGEIMGWYLYYLKQGGIGQVLQIGGKPKCMRKVLNQLFCQAWRQGAVAISGKLEPRFVKELAQNRCGFTWPGYGVLVQSGNREILNAIHQGDAFLTRLEGEWWARFSDPGWSLEGPSRGAPVAGVGHLPDRCKGARRVMSRERACAA
jgi:hypothetical protein